MSKRRYQTLRDRLFAAAAPLNAEAVLEIVCDVLHYDPEAPRYKPEMAETARKYMQRRKEETGMSTYALQNRRAYYEDNKAALNQRRVENDRLRRQRVQRAKRNVDERGREDTQDREEESGDRHGSNDDDNSNIQDGPSGQRHDGPSAQARQD